MSDEKFRSSVISATEGDAEAAQLLAEYYLHFKRDARLGFFWREKAAIEGHPNAQAHLRDFFQTSTIEDYRAVLGRTNLTREELLFNAINAEGHQHPKAE